MKTTYRIPTDLLDLIRARGVKVSRAIREALHQFSPEQFDPSPPPTDTRTLNIYLSPDSALKLHVLQEELRGEGRGVDQQSIITAALKNFLTE